MKVLNQFSAPIWKTNLYPRTRRPLWKPSESKLSPTPLLPSIDLVPLSTKEIGSTEIFATVVDVGEYTIYTSLAWRNKSFGNSILFAWAPDSNTYAVLESKVKLRWLELGWVERFGKLADRDFASWCDVVLWTRCSLGRHASRALISKHRVDDHIRSKLTKVFQLDRR